MKKEIIIALCLTLGSATFAKAQIKPNFVVNLYPQGQEVDAGIVENGIQVTLGPGESNGFSGTEKINEYGNISNIGDQARLEIYLPEKCNGQMVVDCPGGGYQIVSSWNEGSRAADWFVKHGIACCVVIYRLPNHHHTIPLTDVQNAFRYCRAHSEEWGIDQIGIVGYSAGGHLAACASTLYVDKTTRPDFSVLLYPVITMENGVTHYGSMESLTGGNPELIKDYSVENRVTEDTPQTLLILSGDDDIVSPENSLRYFKKLQECGVSSELHIFTDGGHGWGFTTSEYDKDSLGESQRKAFFDTLERWLGNRQ